MGVRVWVERWSEVQGSSSMLMFHQIVQSGLFQVTPQLSHKPISPGTPSNGALRPPGRAASGPAAPPQPCGLPRGGCALQVVRGGPAPPRALIRLQRHGRHRAAAPAVRGQLPGADAHGQRVGRHRAALALRAGGPDAGRDRRPLWWLQERRRCG